MASFSSMHFQFIKKPKLKKEPRKPAGKLTPAQAAKFKERRDSAKSHNSRLMQEALEAEKLMREEYKKDSYQFYGYKPHTAKKKRTKKKVRRKAKPSKADLKKIPPSYRKKLKEMGLL